MARKHAIASILVKHGYGVREAWIMDKMTRARVDEMTAHIDEEVGVFDASLDVLKRLLAHGIAENLASGEPPPFGLIQILELAGMGQIEVDGQTAASNTARLLAAMPDSAKSAAARAAALKRSKYWRAEYQFADSWFEAGDDVNALLAAAKTKKQRVALLLDRYLPDRREWWAGKLAWTADALREDTPEGDWRDMALVADALLAGAPLRDIPLMTHIADLTAVAAAAGAA